MDARIKELIAIGASVTSNCLPCLRFHLRRAREAGAQDREIRAAVAVGRMVRQGAADTWDKEAATLLGTAGADAAEERFTSP